jgi:hypothetical protein
LGYVREICEHKDTRLSEFPSAAFAINAARPWAHDLADSFARRPTGAAPSLTAAPGGNRPPPATKYPAGHATDPPRP